MRNSIITRGLSPYRRNRLITHGYLAFFAQLYHHGRSALKHAYDRVDEFVVYAKLISVNSKQPEEKIEGYIRVLYDYTKHFVIRVLKIAHGVISDINNIFITVKRVK
jgi:hypothetical protein